MTENVVWHQNKISKEERHRLNNHKSVCIWFTGLSGSGKSTLAVELEYYLYKNNIRSYILDGDNVRHGLNKDLGFDGKDRAENIRRIGEVSKLFVEAGLISVTAFISPFRKDRDFVRSLFNKGEFIEVYVECDLETCEKRDPKGLYKKARANEIKDFTGISSPYEPPAKPELTIHNGTDANLEENVRTIINYLKKKKIIN